MFEFVQKFVIYQKHVRMEGVGGKQKKTKK